ncbi:MAG: hypothetical protein KDC87_16015 [Planctomycetes bacterium]|nr:hypothetical protein [Planctomycetota bacterium]MCB9870161.1 hypothetical protein [Planctomycetota bacterium]
MSVDPHRTERDDSSGLNSDASAAIDRRRFVRRAGTAAMLPWLPKVLGSCTATRADSTAAAAVPPQGLGNDYLVHGLTGMARACQKPGWFQAHWGAAVLAAHYLCRDNPLDARLVRAVRTQADALIDKQAFYFRPLEGGAPDPQLTARVAAALEQPIAGLRSHGHAATFAALALRALRDAPSMATPQVVDGLCAISQRIGRNRPLLDHAFNRQHPLEDYGDERSLAEALFACTLRYEGIRYPGFAANAARRPNFTHQSTYTDALIQLHRMGYHDLARRGHAAHRIYVNTAPAKDLPRGRPMHPRARFDVVMSADFWELESNIRAWSADFSDKERMGDWLVGHVFKGLYALARLRRLVHDPETVRRVDQIVLERYVDPTVAGG